MTPEPTLALRLAAEPDFVKRLGAAATRGLQLVLAGRTFHRPPSHHVAAREVRERLAALVEANEGTPIETLEPLAREIGADVGRDILSTHS